MESTTTLISPRHSDEMAWEYSSTFVTISQLLISSFQDIGAYGYNCQVGHCTIIISADKVSLVPQLLYITFGFLLPFITLIVSNLALCKMVRSSSTFLKDSRYAL
jgi:hypothetical protein